MSTTPSMLIRMPLLLSFKTISVFVLGLLAFVLLQTEIDFSGLTSGFQHPFVGNDHLITMLAVGVWAARMRGHAVWTLPMAFVGVMSLGGLAGASGLYLPQVEGLVLLSCGVFGVLIARNIRFSSKINILIVAFFGFFHGFAHGQEISASAGLLSYIVGFVAATLILHGAGIALTKGAIIAFSLLLSALTAPVCSIDQAVKPLADVTLIASANPSIATRTALNSTRIATHKQPDRQRPPAEPLRASPAIPIYHFNRMFPAINHSPGLGLCCNGVGRTSPPLPTILPAWTGLFLVAVALTPFRYSLLCRFLSGPFVTGHHPVFSVCSPQPLSLFLLPKDAYPDRYRFSLTTITRHLSQ